MGLQKKPVYTIHRPSDRKFELFALAGAFLILAAYLSPYIVLGQDAYVRIHDNLDSNVVWYKILASSGLVFAHNDTIVPNILGGIPRLAFGSEFNVQLWLYIVFEPFTAYVTNQTLFRLIALAGMFLFLRRYLLTAQNRWTILLCVGCSLTFALLPFWPSGGLSIAGQPLAVFAFLNIRKGSKSISDWVVIILLPFYSNLVFASVFFVAALCVFAMVDTVNSRRLNMPFLLAIVSHIALYCLVEYRMLIWLFSDTDFISHRSAYEPALVSFGEAWDSFVSVLVAGRWSHAASVHTPVIVTAAIVAFWFVFQDPKTRRPLFACALAIIGIAAYFGLYRWQVFGPVRKLLSLGNGFAADRFYTLLPFLWAFVFALSLKIISGDTYRSRVMPRVYFAGIFIALQIGYLSFKNDFVLEMRSNGISYRAFFASEQFEMISREIGLPKESYRVISLGIHPSISQFNGFYTADGYFVNYPLSQKRALGQLIHAELDKNPVLANYFNGWGSRGYVFSSELGRNYLHTNVKNWEINSLRLDPSTMDSLEIRFLLSAAKILDPASSGLSFRRLFTHHDSAWNIYLYERVDAAP